MPRQHNINGNKVPFTASEEAEWNAKETAWNNGAFDRALQELRNKRNNLLNETDWWGASDNTMTAEQTQYRQELRDITNGLTTVDDVNNVVYPTKPSE
jgi:hypothetical protein